MKKAYEVGKEIYMRTPDQRVNGLKSKIPGEILNIIESKITEAVEEGEHKIEISIAGEIAYNSEKVRKLLEELGYKGVKITSGANDFSSIHFDIPKYSPPSSSSRD